MLRTAPKRLAPRHRWLRTVPTSPTIRLAVAPKHNPNGTVFPRHNGTFCQWPGQMGLDQYEVRRLLTPLGMEGEFPSRLCAVLVLVAPTPPSQSLPVPLPPPGTTGLNSAFVVLPCRGRRFLLLRAEPAPMAARGPYLKDRITFRVSSRERSLRTWVKVSASGFSQATCR